MSFMRNYKVKNQRNKRINVTKYGEISHEVKTMSNILHTTTFALAFPLGCRKRRLNVKLLQETFLQTEGNLRTKPFTNPSCQHIIRSPKPNWCTRIQETLVPQWP